MKTPFWKNPKIIMMIVIAILVAALCIQQGCIRNLKLDQAKSEQNIAVLLDTIRTSKNKLGQIEFEKNVLVSSKKGLEDLNADLSKQVNAEKGKVAYLSHIVAEIRTKYDSMINIPAISFGGNPCDTIVNYDMPWKFSKTYDQYNYKKLEGVTSFTMDKGKMIKSGAKVTEDVIGFNIVTGLKKNGDYYEIFVRSDYPGFKPTKIDGAFIPQKDLFPTQKKQHWSIGPTFNASLGMGVYPNVTPMIYVGVGLGINYSWIKF